MVLAFIAVAIGNAAIAGTGGGEVDKRVRKAFEKEYAGAGRCKMVRF